MSLSNDPYNPGRGSIIFQAIQFVKEEEEEEKKEELNFRDAELQTVAKVLDVIDRSADKRIQEGFNDWNFTIGVLDCFLVCVVFAAYPQHFWLLYFCECFYLIPQTFRFNWRSKPLNQVLYYLDYCWVMNILSMIIIFSLSTLSLFSYETRREIFLLAAGTNTGTLTGACLILPFVAIVFHDLRTMTGVMIHLLPTMMTYTILWERPAMKQAWPGIFEYEYDFSDMHFFPNGKPGLFWPGTGTGSVAGNAVALYCIWWICYVIWMVFLGGLDLPRKDRDQPPRWDTVFHSTVRNGLCVVIGKVCWGRPAAESRRQQEMDHYELRDFFVYMTFHALLAYFGGTLILANISWHYRQAHLAIIILLIVVAVYRGAARYTYYATDMYGRTIRREFKDILPDKKDKTK